MPKRQRKEYSKDYKLAAVMLMKSKALKPAEVFEILGGIDRQTVYRWVNEYDEKGEAAFTERSALLQERNLQALQKENAALKEENAVLKKAATYFAALQGEN